MAKHTHETRARAVGKEFEGRVLKALIEMRGGFSEATSVAGHLLGRHVGGDVSADDHKVIGQVRKALRKMFDQGMLNARWNFTHTQITGYQVKRATLVKWEPVADTRPIHMRAQPGCYSNKAGQPRAGVCRVCGCTELQACLLPAPFALFVEGDAYMGCSWADATRTLCTNPACLAAAKGGA